MEKLRLINATLFQKSYLTLVAWAAIVLPVAYVTYSFITYLSSDRSELPLIPISIGAAVLILTLAGLFVYHQRIIQKRDEQLLEIHKEWKEKDGTTYDSSNGNKQKLKKINDSYSVTWGKNSDIDELTIRCEGEKIEQVQIQKFIDYLDTKAKDGNRYTFKLNDVLSDEICIKQAEVTSHEYKMFNAYNKVLNILKKFNVVGVREIPKITFSEDFESGNKDFFKSVMIEETTLNTSSRDIKKTIELFQESYPAANKYKWAFENISSSVFAFKMVSENDDRFKVESAEKFLNDAYSASAKNANVSATLDYIDIISSEAGLPLEFDVVFTNEPIFENDELKQLVKNMVKLLSGNFGGKWRASNRIVEEDLLKFKSFTE